MDGTTEEAAVSGNDTAEEPRAADSCPPGSLAPLDVELARGLSTDDKDKAASPSGSGEGYFCGFRLHFPGFASRQNSLQDEEDDDGDMADDQSEVVGESPDVIADTPSPVFLPTKKRLYNVKKARKDSKATKKLRLDSVAVDDPKSEEEDAPELQPPSAICTKKSSGTELPGDQCSDEDPPRLEVQVSRAASVDSIQVLDETLAYIHKIFTDTSKKMEQLCCNRKYASEPEAGLAAPTASGCTEVSRGGVDAQAAASVDGVCTDCVTQEQPGLCGYEAAMEAALEPDLGGIFEGPVGVDKSSQVDSLKPFPPFWHWPSPSSSPKVAVVSPLTQTALPKRSVDDVRSGAGSDDRSRAAAVLQGPSTSAGLRSESWQLAPSASHSSHGGLLPLATSTPSSRGAEGGQPGSSAALDSPASTSIARGHKKADDTRSTRCFVPHTKGIAFLDTSSSSSEEEVGRWQSEAVGQRPHRTRKRGSRPTKFQRWQVEDTSSESDTEALTSVAKKGERRRPCRTPCPEHTSAARPKGPSVRKNDKRPVSLDWLSDYAAPNPCILCSTVDAGPAPGALQEDLFGVDQSSDSDSQPLLHRRHQCQAVASPGMSARTKKPTYKRRTSFRRPFDIDGDDSSCSEGEPGELLRPGNETFVRPARDKASLKVDGSSKAWCTLFNRRLDPSIFSTDTTSDEDERRRPSTSAVGGRSRPLVTYDDDDSTDSDVAAFPSLSPLSRRAPLQAKIDRRDEAFVEVDAPCRPPSGGGRTRSECNLRRNAHSTPDLRLNATVTLDLTDEGDAVRQIEQIESDEAYAKMLQAQFDAELVQSPRVADSDSVAELNYVPSRGSPVVQHRYPRSRQSARMTCPSSSGYRQRAAPTRQASARPSQQSLLNAYRHRLGSGRTRGSHDSLTTLLPMIEDVVGYHGDLVHFLTSIASLPIVQPDSQEANRGPALRSATGATGRHRPAPPRNAVSDDSDGDPVVFVDSLEYLINTDDDDDHWPASGRRRSTHGGPGARRRAPRGHRHRGGTPAGAMSWTYLDGNGYEELLELAERLGHVSRGLSRSQVNRLPTRLFGRGDAAAASTAQRSTECHICMSDYETGERLRILPCFHEFHTTCIDRWLMEKNTCPVCRLRVQVN